MKDCYDHHCFFFSFQKQSIFGVEIKFGIFTKRTKREKINNKDQEIELKEHLRCHQHLYIYVVSRVKAQDL